MIEMATQIASIRTPGNNAQTMSSREIAELTGKSHSHVMRDIRAMIPAVYAVEHGEDTKSYAWSSSSAKTLSRFLDRIDVKGVFVEQRKDNGQVAAIHLDRYHTEVLITGYDVKRRAAVIKRWYELETQQAAPLWNIKDPQLAAVATMLTQLDAVKQEQASQRNELADIRAKITATPHEHYTVAGYASLRGININVKRASLLGRKASKLSREYGMDIGETHSEVFGTVNTYHVDVLADVFEQEA